MVKPEPRELALMGQADEALAKARTLHDIKDIRDKAQATHANARKFSLSKSIIVHASTLKVQAERRLGEMLQALPLANSSPGNQYTGKLNRSHDATGSLRLKDLGITKSDSSILAEHHGFNFAQTLPSPYRSGSAVSAALALGQTFFPTREKKP